MTGVAIVDRAAPPTADSTAEDPAPTTAQLLAAIPGDTAALGQLMNRYVRLLWSVTNSCQLSEPDAQDVIQTTWIRLLEHVGQIREPQYLHQWLKVTARRECWRVTGAQKAPELLGDEMYHALAAADDPVDAALLRREERKRLWDAVRQLPPTQQRVVRTLCSSAEPSYDEVATMLGIPRGSVGPTRLRALRRLRALLAEEGTDTERPAATGLEQQRNGQWR